MFKRGVIQADALKKRNKSNAVSLSGQLFSALVETFVSNFIIVIIHNHEAFGLERVTFAIVMPICTMLVSAITFFSSHEMKRHYEIDKIFKCWSPNAGYIPLVVRYEADNDVVEIQ